MFPGIAIATALSAQDALRRCAAQQFDAVLTDIRMPGMDGIALAREIRKLRPNTPVLLMSGHLRHEEREEAQGKALEFLPKPIQRDELTAWVTAALERRRMEAG